jgi:hypothetical protein
MIELDLAIGRLTWNSLAGSDEVSMVEVPRSG